MCTFGVEFVFSFEDLFSGASCLNPQESPNLHPITVLENEKYQKLYLKMIIDILVYSNNIYALSKLDNFSISFRQYLTSRYFRKRSQLTFVSANANLSVNEPLGSIHTKRHATLENYRLYLLLE